MSGQFGLHDSIWSPICAYCNSVIARKPGRAFQAPPLRSYLAHAGQSEGSKSRLFLCRIAGLWCWGVRGIAMAGQPGFFDRGERLKALSAAGDPLERLAQIIDFEVFREDLEATLARSDRAKGGRPPYDAVMMFKILMLQTLYTLSDDQSKYQLKDRLSFMRFVGLALPHPDAKTIWLYRERLAQAGASERFFARFDALPRAKGWLAMGS
jgi:Transposase domain (DUF772)